MNRKTVLAGASAVMLAGTAIGGVSGVTAAKAKPVTIVVASWSGTNVTNGIIDAQLAAFNKAHPNIHAVYRPIAGNYQTVIQTELVAGDAPDIITINNGGQAPTFESLGAVVPLTKYINASHYSLKDFFAGAIDMFKTGRTVYGIPRDQSPLALYYNPAMFKAAGIKSPPTTWAQLYADAKKLTNAKKKIYGLVQTPQEPRWAQLLYQAGGSVMNKTMTKMTLNTPAALKGFTYFVHLYRSGVAAQPSQVGATWGGQALGMGRAAMTFEGAWAIPYLQDTYPKTKFAIVQLPKGPVNNDTLDFPTAWGITKDSKHQQLAWEVIKYLTGVGEARWVEQGGLVTVRKSLINMPYYKQHPIYKNILAALPKGIPWTFPNGFNQYSTVTLNNVSLEAVDGKITPKAALSQLQTAGEQILKGNGG
jgi:multiple sugar transport system substrate-binding protein